MNREDEAKAAEYVLGTLSADERRAFERSLGRDAALRDEVRAWERRLAPLAEAVDAATPPGDLYDRIERQIAAEGAGRQLRFAALERSRAMWRSAALAASALAAALVLYLSLGSPTRPAGGDYLAVVDRGGDLPALLVRVDLTHRRLAIQSVAAQAPADRSLELWLIAGGRAPASLGVMDAPSRTRVLPAVLTSSDLAQARFAVSVEPPGGSASGQPTGPIVYSGRLIPTPAR